MGYINLIETLKNMFRLFKTGDWYHFRNQNVKFSTQILDLLFNSRLVLAKCSIQKTFSNLMYLLTSRILFNEPHILLSTKDFVNQSNNFDWLILSVSCHHN